MSRLCAPYISRRAALIGAASAFAARKALAAGSYGFSGSDKDTDITPNNHPYFGPNTFITQSGGSSTTYETGRLNFNNAAGKLMVEFCCRLIGASTGAVDVGGGIGSRTIPGSNTTSFGYYNNQQFSNRAWVFNNSTIAGANPGTGIGAGQLLTGDVVGLAIDLTNNRVAACIEKVWGDPAGSGIDPTTTGYDISGWRSGAFTLAAAIYGGGTSSIGVNCGGYWPLLNPVPSGFSVADPGGPAAIPRKTRFLSVGSSTQVATDQSGMRLRTISSSGGSNFLGGAMNGSLPSGAKYGMDFIPEACGGTVASASGNKLAVGLYNTASGSTPGTAYAVQYQKNGTVNVITNSGTVNYTLPTWEAWDVITMSVWDGHGLWFQINGGAYNGNGSAIPSVNTTGQIDISNLAGGPFTPLAQCWTDSTMPAISANFGATALSQTLPSGFSPIESFFITNKAGGQIIYNDNPLLKPARRRLILPSQRLFVPV